MTAVDEAFHGLGFGSGLWRNSDLAQKNSKESKCCRFAFGFGMFWSCSPVHLFHSKFRWPFLAREGIQVNQMVGFTMYITFAIHASSILQDHSAMICYDSVAWVWRKSTHEHPHEP